MFTETNPAIDDTDRKIISILASRGRMSFKELGSIVHLSSNATAVRVRRLETLEIVRGFRADIDHAKLGFNLLAYVDVRLQPGTTAQSFEAAVMKLSGITSSAVLSGPLDFRLKVVCKDQSDLMRIIEALRGRGGAQHTSSSVILREVKCSAG